MRGKIFRYTFLTGIAILVLCVTLFSVVLHKYYERQIFNSLSAEASYVSQGLTALGEDYFLDFSSPDRVTWVASDGHVLYDSAAQASTMENHLNREEIREAMETGSGQSTHFSDTMMQKTLYYAKLLSDGTVLRISCTQRTVMAMLLRMAGPITWAVGLVVLLSGLLAYGLAQQITRPINAMDLDVPEIRPAYPELQPLALRLQEQNRTIRRQMEELSLRQREFSAITENMGEGFLLLDQKKNMLSGNHSAHQLLRVQDAKNIKEADCDPAFCRAVDRALAGERAEALLTEGGASWQLIVSPVQAEGQVTGAVVILVDVTEREQRETLRREFSANVSHELKTPLTSISGFAELMKEGLVPPEKIPEFSGDIWRETLRLIDLVNDIINLSRLDEATEPFEKERVDLYALSQDVLQGLQLQADKKQVSLRLAGEHLSINGVPQILQEMIFNLCDNAIKYNREGGSVTVSLELQASETRLSVADTGVGIPYAAQNRVFERFYRVDKSHSRAVGGTGLGLSIVKHGAQYHAARIELHSTPGVGTVITLIFP